MRRFNVTVLATLFVATSATPALGQAETNPGGLAAEHNRCSSAQFKGEQQQYIKLYHKVQKQISTRAPGRNIVCDGVRTKRGLRTAHRDEVGQSADRLQGMLVSATSATSTSTPVGTSGVSKATLDAIAMCESTMNPRAIGGGGAYRGLFQFAISTWQSVGGTGDPAAASVEEQYYRAGLLYSRDGAGQWPVCGR